MGSTANPKGYTYTDRQLTPDGVKKLRVVAGVEPKAKAIVKGKGENLRLPALPLPLVAQLQTTTACWEGDQQQRPRRGAAVGDAGLGLEVVHEPGLRRHQVRAKAVTR